MDYNKKFDELQSCMKNFDIKIASKLLCITDFVITKAGEIINLLGTELTEDNLKNSPCYFNFCEEQLLKIAQIGDYECIIYDFLDLINIHTIKLSSSVLAAVTILENTETPDRVCLEYLLIVTFNHLIEINNNDLNEILLCTIKHLLKLNGHFQHEQSILYYFSRVAFLVLRANIDPFEYLDLLSSIFIDPFCLLEYEFDEMDEKIYVASFYYLYFKTGMLWGPKIYSRFYVLEKCFHLAMSVFENNSFGKYFAKLILSKFKDNEIPLYFLNKCHEVFLVEAAKSSMYNEHIDIRKESIDTLKEYVNKLCSDAQYIVFKYIFTKWMISAVKAEMIISMKNVILLKIRLKQDLGYFQGVRLLELVKICCDNIPDGPKCHVVENKEYVLATITLMCVLYRYSIEVLNMGKAFSIQAIQFEKTVQNAIDYTNEQYKIEYYKLDNNIIDDKKYDIMGYPKLSISEKWDMLSKINTTNKMVQLNLDLLKEIINNNDLR